MGKSRSAPPILTLREVSKDFGKTRALTEVNMDFHPGEVHVLAGENGAGKSTLIGILAGIHSDYAGHMAVDGKATRFTEPQDAMRAGIATIFQELSLVGAMSIADNLLLSAPEGPWQAAHRKRWQQRAVAILAKLNLPFAPHTLVERLDLASQQLVEIARALSHKARLLIMDEPTSALPEGESEKLFAQIRSLRDQGTSILFISHRLEDIYKIADRITVLRDGQVVACAPAKELPREKLIAAMVGRELQRETTAAKPPLGPPMLSVQQLSLRDHHRVVLDRVTFELRKGEVLGVAGLQGSGASELAYALCGAAHGVRTGDISIAGERLENRGPREALQRKMVLLSGDRQRSVFRDASVLANASIASLDRYSPRTWVDDRQAKHDVQALTKRLALDCPSLEANMGQLSGGNQQKVCFMRCLLTQPRILLLDEPSRGIDIGAKADVYDLIRALSKQGVSVLLISSDLDELIDLSHRVLVLARARVVTELPRERLSREAILRAAMAENQGVA